MKKELYEVRWYQKKRRKNCSKALFARGDEIFAGDGKLRLKELRNWV